MGLKVTTWLIIITSIFFIFTAFLFSFDKECKGACSYFALQPKNVFQNYYFWTLLTSIFMHANFAHLFFNMFTLFFIGSFVESIIGRKRFVWFYLASGIFASFFFSILAYYFGNSVVGGRIFGGPEMFAVGASGALFGLLGIAAIITPKSKVYLIAGPLIAIIVQVILEKFIKSNPILIMLNFIIMLYIFISIFSIFSFNLRMRKLALQLEMPFWLLPFVAIIPLLIIGLFVALPIGNMAHLGGLISGIVYGIYLRKRYPKKIKLLNRYFR